MLRREGWWGRRGREGKRKSMNEGEREERERERDEGCIEGERKKEKGVTFVNNTIIIIIIITPHHPQARGTGMETVVFERPIDSRLEHVDFSLLFNTLSQRKVIQVFSSLLMERRVILVAQSLSLLSGCAHALLALLYPFEWQVCVGIYTVLM